MKTVVHIRKFSSKTENLGAAARKKERAIET